MSKQPLAFLLLVAILVGSVSCAIADSPPIDDLTETTAPQSQSTAQKDPTMNDTKQVFVYKTPEERAAEALIKAEQNEKNPLYAAYNRSLSFHFNNEFPCGGSQAETDYASGFAHVATSIAEGKADGFYIDHYINTIRKMLSNAKYMPDLSGGLNGRQHSPFVYAIALLWQHEEVMSRFTEKEIEQLELFWKAALFSTAFSLSDVDENGKRRSAQRVTVHGDDNCWHGGNPNHYEPNLTLFYGATMCLGFDASKELVKNFDLDEFLAELKAATKEAPGFEAIHNAFKQTRGGNTLNFKNSWDNKKRQMEGVINNPDRWTFKGVTMTEYFSDPMALYYATQKDIWANIAEDGDYIGMLGMEKEFQSTDQSGIRQNSGYVAYGIDPTLLNRALMVEFGYWDLPENQKRTDEIHNWQLVGVSDYYAKVINGYNDLSWMGMHLSDISKIPSVYFLETMKRFDLLDEAIFNDTFTYNLQKNMEKKWYTVGTWKPSSGTIIPYNFKQKSWSKSLSKYTTPIVSDPNETIVKTNESEAALTWTKEPFYDVNYHVWIKRGESGEVGIMTDVQDENNYYLFAYDGDYLSIRRVVDGKVAVLAECNTQLENRNAHRFRAIVKDGTLSFHVDGKEYLCAEDMTFSYGAVGMYSDHSDASFDAVLVQEAK